MGLTKKIFDHEIAHVSVKNCMVNRIKGVSIQRPPVFIVGCGHSGTTMLRHVLGLHSGLYAVPYESRVFFHSGLKQKLAALVWSCAAIAEGKTRWVEKTPAHVYHMDKILRSYPNARIILLIRDGRNVAVSLRARWGDFERSVRRWVDDNRAGEDFWGHPQVLRLNYESLVSEFEESMRLILSFIDEPFDPAMMSFVSRRSEETGDQEPGQVEEVTHRQLRSQQIERGLYHEQDKWRTRMSEEEKEIFKHMAGQMLIAYGYADNLDW